MFEGLLIPANYQAELTGEGVLIRFECFDEVIIEVVQIVVIIGFFAIWWGIRGEILLLQLMIWYLFNTFH